ncbi:hypothetical protein SAMN05421813_11375 [Daejeonella rubra]|uniref:Uncharacterized protein n=1 Tax=Daejeonella rubra TaxID=990371 RepID=A0A1G9TMG2_9SPHI|nr:hypothetical protein [Daejeonella rubra]SDM48738.1 hypothetical protein SAMN05421813_11375 [Daejeonella rubra]
MGTKITLILPVLLMQYISNLAYYHIDVVQVFVDGYNSILN